MSYKCKSFIRGIKEKKVANKWGKKKGDQIIVNTSMLTNWVQIESLKAFLKTIQVGHNNLKRFSIFLWSWNMLKNLAFDF